MPWLYLASIVFSMFGMVVTDWRYKLAFWKDVRRSILTNAVGVGLFIVWDIFGISLEIFFSGHSAFMSGIYLAPELPIEELFFLIFLCYFTLVVYRLLENRP